MTLQRFSLAFRLSLALLAGGCGGIEPGDYLVYRIAFQDTARSGDCFGGGQVPVDEQDDSSSIYLSGTFILFVGADDRYYLDTGSMALGGTESDDGFTFSGSLTDVEVEGDEMDPTTTTTKVDTTVNFSLEGEVVEGVYQRGSSFSCEGPGCPDPAASTCTETTPFVGGEVADVELEHEV